MAVGNAIVTTAKFKPLSYDEWAKPILALNEAHEKTEEALWKLQDEADEYQQYIMEHPNSEVSKQYSAYLDSLNQEIDNLASKGITPESRTALTNLRRTYGSKVKPVKSAVERFKADEKLIQADRAKGIIGREHNLEDYLNDPSYSYSYITGDKVAEDFSKAFSTLAQNTISAPEFQAKVGGSQYWQIMQAQGYNQADILNAVMHNPSLAPEVYNAIPTELKEATTSLRNQYGYNNFTDEEKSMFDSYAYKGALSGMKKVSYSLQSNKGYESPSVAWQREKYQEAEKQKNQIIKQDIKDEKGNIIDSYYTLNGDRVALKDGKWIYYGTDTSENPNGIPIGYKPPTYTAPKQTSTDMTDSQYLAELNKLPAVSQYIDEDGDYAEAAYSWDDIMTGERYTDWESLPDDKKNLLLKTKSNLSGNALKRAINEGKYSVVVYKGYTYLIKED